MASTLYRRMLVGLQLDPKSDEAVVNKVKELKLQYQPEIILVHAVESLLNYGAYGGAYGVTTGVDMEQMLVSEAKQQLTDIANTLSLGEDNLIVELGSAKQVLLNLAKEKDVDVIVIGSHGKHGIRLLLGSTANGVLHGAPCDVLAVRISEHT